MRFATFAIVAVVFCAAISNVPEASSAGGLRLAVAWDDARSGALASMRTAAPWKFAKPRVEPGGNTLLRTAGKRLYAVSRDAGTITVVRLRDWTVERVFDLGANSQPQDIAVLDAGVAYVTRADATRLLRLDLTSGATREVVDLGGFAGSDGIPDLGTMELHEGRLFVQIRRIDFDAQSGFESPPYLAVVDVTSEQLVDIDPDAPGVQAIALEGTAPKLRMQVVAEARRLFVSATGGFFDRGGIEAVDLDTLRSLGLVVREEDGHVGADLGAFVMTAPDRGFLVYSTDLTLSSHLHEFTIEGGVRIGPQLHVSVDYAVPAVEYDSRTQRLFLPVGGHGTNGVEVFDARTGARLTTKPTATGSSPADLLLVPRR